MAELSTAEAEQQADASFAAGFTGTPPTEVVKVADEPKVETKVDATPAPAAKPAKPEYIRVTRQDWDNTKAMVGKVSSLESQVAKLTGSVPKADAIIQQVIEKVQAQTPSGLNVEFSDEDFAELAEDFPELSKSMRASLERIFKKANVKGTGTAEGEPRKPATPMDQDAVKAVVAAALKEKADAEATEVQEKEMAALTAAYPDWAKTVGQPQAMGTTEPVKTEWRTWLETQPADYQETMAGTQSAAVIQASIDKFMAEKTPGAQRPDRAATRRAAIEDAVTPRFDGSAPPLVQNKSADEAFAESFAKTRRK